MALARASLAVLFALTACRSDASKATASSAEAAAPSGTASTEPSGKPFVMSSVPASQWSDRSPEPVELVVAPNRAAFVTFEGMNGGYVVHRGDQFRRLPREWFGAGPPRRDLSISGNGMRLAIPTPPTADELAAVTVYDTEARRFLARLALPLRGAADGGAVEVKLSEDGKSVVWTSPSRACMVTDIETGTVAKCPGK